MVPSVNVDNLDFNIVDETKQNLSNRVVAHTIFRVRLAEDSYSVKKVCVKEKHVYDKKVNSKETENRVVINVKNLSVKNRLLYLHFLVVYEKKEVIMIIYYLDIDMKVELIYSIKIVSSIENRV